jgi:hypothetical protein
MRSIPENPGIHRDVLEPDERRFTKLIPEGYNGENHEPLILALHWGGPKWPFIGESLLGELVEPALEELGEIIVAPDLTYDDWNSPCSEAYVHRAAASLLTSSY